MIVGGRMVGCNEVLWVEDLFSEASNINLDLHTPDLDPVGTGWVSYDQYGTGLEFTVDAASDRAKAVTRSDHQASVIDIGATKFRAVADITLPASLGATYYSDFGFVFGFVDINNFYRANIAAQSDEGLLQLSKRVGGSYISLANTAHLFTPGDTVTLEIIVDMEDATVTVNCDGATATSSLDEAALNAATKMGFRLQESGAANRTWYADNFRVYVCAG